MLSASPKMSHLVAVGALAFTEGKLLLAKRRDTLRWLPPGGHLKIHEDPIYGLKREIQEELSVDVESLALFHSVCGTHKGQTILALFFLATLTSTDFILNDELSDASWFDLDRIERNRVDFPEVDKGMYRKAYTFWEKLHG